LTFPGGVATASFVVTVRSGAQVAQATVGVIIEPVNDAPTFLGGALAVEGAAGELKVWDLSALFGDEEDAAGLTFTASDPRVVIDMSTRTARLTLPPSGDVRFTLTAADGSDPTLSATSPQIVATTVATPTGTGRVEAGAGGDLPLLALFLALGAGLALLQRRDGGRALGARANGPTFARRER
jgi:hypothetical protein